MTELATIALRGWNGKHVCCDQNGAVACNRDWVKIWEFFRVIGLEDGRVALKTHFNNYLFVDPNVNAIRGGSGSVGSERFTVVFAGSRIGFRTRDNNYLSARQEGLCCMGTLATNIPHFLRWEQFDVVMINGSFSTLVSFEQSLQIKKEREAERARMEAERRAMQQQIDANKAAMARQAENHRKEQERRAAEEKQRRREDAKQRYEILQSHIRRIEVTMGDVQETIDKEDTKLSQIATLLSEEQAARSRFVPPGGAEQATKLVMIGHTGDGKSTLGNWLLDDDSSRGNQGPFSTCSGHNSRTQAIQTEFVEENGIQFCVADTPGVGDSGGRDKIHATTLVDFLHGIGSVDAFVFVTSCMVRRMDIYTRRMLRDLNRILTDAVWDNLIVVLTHADCMEADELGERKRNFPEGLQEVLELREEIIDNLTIVEIGRNSFTAQRKAILQAVVECNGGHPFVSDGLIAPVEERQMEFDEQKRICDGLKTKLARLRYEQGELVEQQQMTRSLIQDL